MKFFQNDTCLYCDQIMEQEFTWESLLLGTEKKLLCRKCQSKFELIEGETCLKCGRVRNDHFETNEICLDCLKWETDEKWKGVLEKNISLFVYNNFMAELIAKYKYRGDYCLAKIFSSYIREATRKLEYDYIVPIPLSKERLYERGFNQVEALLIEANIKYDSILFREHSEKQSKKSREERIRQENVFKLNECFNLKGKHVLLVDDIYTTGATLRKAAKILYTSGASVSSLTLIRS